MNAAKQLLKFNFDENNFIATSRNIISLETKKRIEKSLTKLRSFDVNLHPVKIEKHFDYEDIYITFFSNVNNGVNTLDALFKTKKKVRQLSKSLDYLKNDLSISNSHFLDIALKIISAKFSPSMLLPIFDSLLKNWNHPNFELLQKFISNQILRYDGKRKQLIIIKNNLRFFKDHTGATKLASTLISDNKQLSEVFHYLNLSNSFIRYPYFGETATSFTQTILRTNNPEQSILDIITFLEGHADSSTFKKCISIIIVKQCSSMNESVKNVIKNSAMKNIGDPANDAYWLPWADASTTEKKQLKEAQLILNGWINKELIEIFFHKIIIDRNRKQFWLKYKGIGKIKIFSPYNLHMRLRSDERIKPFLEERFGYLENAGNEQSALVMEVNNYVLVEFSIIGTAFYAYKRSNQICPDINKKYLSKYNLIKPTMPQLLRRAGNTMYGLSEEGRLTHQGDWEYFFAEWLHRFVGIRGE